MGKIDEDIFKAAKKFSEMQGDVSSRYAFESGARWYRWYQENMTASQPIHVADKEGEINGCKIL